jgi:tetratricopeptide (TPR) repeat protein
LIDWISSEPRVADTSGDPPSALDRWPGWLSLGSAALLAIFACFHRVWATDVWWQYKAGEYINNHGWPTVDVFSYTLTNEPWVELRWLFCLAQYWLMEHLGPTSLIVAKTLAVIAAFALVALPVIRRSNRAVTGFVLSAAVMAASLRFLVRPEIVTWLFAALFVFILDRYRRGDARAIWLLPLLQIVWVNSHTLFIFGPLLIGLALFVTLLGPLAGWVGLAAIGGFAFVDSTGLGTGGLAGLAVAGAALTGAALWRERGRLADATARRRSLVLGGVLVAGVLVCFVNPWGLDGFMVPFDQFLQISNSIYAGALTEYQSPFFYGLRLSSVIWYEVLLLLVAVSALLNLRRMDAFWLLFCASQLYLSTVAVRNLPLFCLAAVPFVVSNLDRSSILAGLRAPTRAVLRAGVAVLTAAVFVWYGVAFATDRFSLRQRDSNQFGTGFAEHRYPVGAVEFLDRNDVHGRVYATMLHAAYALAHDRHVFADPRGDVYPNAKLAEFLRVQSDPVAWVQAVQKYDIRVAVVDPRTNLIPILRGIGGWELVWFDSVAAVFIREDTLGDIDPIDTDEEFNRVQARLREELPSPRPYRELGWFERATIPNPYLALADFMYSIRRPADSLVWLDDAETASPFFDRIHHRRVALAELIQDWPAVIRHAPAALEEVPDDAQVQHVLGLAFLRQGDLANAKIWLTRAVENRPERAATWSLLGEVAIGEQDLDAATRYFSRAIELAPKVAAYHGNLARVRLMMGDSQGAFEAQEEALRQDPNNVSALHDLAQFYIARGDAASARPFHEKAWRLAPNHPMLVRQRQMLEALEANPGLRSPESPEPPDREP